MHEAFPVNFRIGLKLELDGLRFRMGLGLGSWLGGLGLGLG